METSYYINLEESLQLSPEIILVISNQLYKKIEVYQLNSKKNELHSFNTLDGQSIFIFCSSN